MSSWPKLTGATNYFAHLELPDIGCGIKGLVVCYAMRLGSLKNMGLKTCVRCVGLVPFCGQEGYRAQVPQHTIKHNHNK